MFAGLHSVSNQSLPWGSREKERGGRGDCCAGVEPGASDHLTLGVQGGAEISST
jgi:hypothetical protein